MSFHAKGINTPRVIIRVGVNASRTSANRASICGADPIRWTGVY